MLSRNPLLHYQICSFFGGLFFFVHPKMCICLQSRRRHLAAGRFRAWRAVRRASVLSAPCESQCGRIRRISAARELLVWETEVTRRCTARCNRLWDVCVCVWSCVALNVALCDNCETWASPIMLFQKKGKKTNVKFVRRNGNSLMSVAPPAVLDDRIAVTTVPLFSSHPLNLLAQLSAKYCPKLKASWRFSHHRDRYYKCFSIKTTYCIISV